MAVTLVQTGVKFPDGTTQITAASAPPVTSVNGMTGAVTVNVPVTSVNGQTGAVSIGIPAWNLSFVNLGLGEGSLITVPSNCIGFYAWTYIYGGSNTGARNYVQLRNASNNAYFTYYVSGTNENGGPDGGSGMQDSAGSFIPIDSQCRYLYWYSSNAGRSFGGYLQSWVLSA